MMFAPILIDRNWDSPDFTLELSTKPCVGELIMISDEKAKLCGYSDGVCCVENIMYNDDSDMAFVLLSEYTDYCKEITTTNLDNVLSALEGISYSLGDISSRLDSNQFEMGRSLDSIEQSIDSVKSEIFNLRD